MRLTGIDIELVYILRISGTREANGNRPVRLRGEGKKCEARRNRAELGGNRRGNRLKPTFKSHVLSALPRPITRHRSTVTSASNLRYESLIAVGRALGTTCGRDATSVARINRDEAAANTSPNLSVCEHHRPPPPHKV